MYNAIWGYCGGWFFILNPFLNDFGGQHSGNRMLFCFLRRIMEISKSRRIASIGRKAIKEIPELSYIRDSNIRIAYLSSWDEKRKNGKIVYADCKKVSPLYQWTCPYDFMITVYEPNVADFDDQQMQILIWHELRHVGINTDGNEDSFYTVPHDIEEFRSIIDAFGIDWSESNAKRR